MDVLLRRPSKLSSPNKNSLHKKALRRVAQNKNTLPWLPICPSSSSQNVKPVSSLINISKLGNNAQEGQEPCLAGASAARCSGCWHHSLEVQHAVQTRAPAGLRNDMALLAPFRHTGKKVCLANSHKEPKGSKLSVTTEFRPSQSGLYIWEKLLRVAELSWALVECWVTFLASTYEVPGVTPAVTSQMPSDFTTHVTWGDKITPNWKVLWKWNQWRCTLFFSNKGAQPFSTVTWCLL